MNRACYIDIANYGSFFFGTIKDINCPLSKEYFTKTVCIGKSGQIFVSNKRLERPCYDIAWQVK